MTLKSDVPKIDFDKHLTSPRHTKASASLPLLCFDVTEGNVAKLSALSGQLFSSAVKICDEFNHEFNYDPIKYQYHVNAAIVNLLGPITITGISSQSPKKKKLHAKTFPHVHTTVPLLQSKMSGPLNRYFGKQGKSKDDHVELGLLVKETQQQKNTEIPSRTLGILKRPAIVPLTRTVCTWSPGPGLGLDQSFDYDFPSVTCTSR